MGKIIWVLYFLLSTYLVDAQHVGIGTTNPVARLHVADSSVLFSADGSIPGMTGLPPLQGPGRRMMWFPGKAAFRVGYVNADQWDQFNIGNYSFAAGHSTNAAGHYSTALGHGAYAVGAGSVALGTETLANGDYSTAMGILTTASGYISMAMGSGTTASGSYSTATGDYSTASGDYSFAMGSAINAKSAFETVMGRWNVDYSPVSAVAWIPTDRLFSIANGTGDLYRSNALTILKNGKTGIGIASPLFKLDVRDGSINTDSVYRIGTITVLTVPGDGNLFVGKNVGTINTGFGNTFSGEQAGEDNTSGFYNSFYGRGTGANNNSGNYNSFFGQAAGANNTIAGENSFFGSASGFANSTGTYNSFFGRFAGYLNVTGSSNCFFGHSAGTYNDIGQSNAFFGNGAGSYNTSGNYNTANGYGALTANYTGIRNTALGYIANVNSSELTNATAIGANARVDCSDCLVLGSVNTVNGATSNVKVGIGNTNPGFPLSFAQALGDKISLWSNSLNSYGFGIQSGLFQMHTDVSFADIVFGYGSSSSLMERMRIKNTGETGMQLNGRIELKNGTIPLNNAYGPGIWLYNADNSGVLGFVGTQNNQNMGFYGGPDGWGFTYDAINSRVGIGTTTPAYRLDVTSSLLRTGNFVSTSSSEIGVGVYGSCLNSSDNGYGVYGEGGFTGVAGNANLDGDGTHLGVAGYGSYGTDNFGVFGKAESGINNYGIYGEAIDGSNSNWAGYFAGGVIASSYSFSDRKLKTAITPITSAMSIIQQLNPMFYKFRTDDYQQMHLPEGIHYGLIADEVEQVIPGIVLNAVHPAQYENHDKQNGLKLNDEVEFSAVNYNEIVSILVAAVKEQQQQIDELKLLVDELLKK